MSFVSAIQPLCRYCGKPIKKRTEWVRFGCSEFAHERNRRDRTERPADKVEAQRYVNGQIVAVRRSEIAQVNSDRAGFSCTLNVPSYIGQVSVWDGETYEDEFFCTASHAQSFGYACARAGRATEAYNDAIRRRNAGS